MSEARVPLVPLTSANPVVAQVFKRFELEGREPIALYRVLAHAPELLRGYNALATALRYETVTPRKLRELVILRIASLTRSQYEWSHHRSFAVELGIADHKVSAVGRWRDSDCFSASERVALSVADAVHEVDLSEPVWASCVDEFGEAGAVELVLLCSFYEMVTRIIQGLGLAVEPDYREHVSEDFGSSEEKSE